MKKNKIKKSEPFQAPSWMRKKDRIKTAEIINNARREAKIKELKEEELSEYKQNNVPIVMLPDPSTLKILTSSDSKVNVS